MLPKFLIADNSQEFPEKIYVVHNEPPRFIVESDIEDFYRNQHIYWIDDKPDDEDLIEGLIEEADDFIEAEFNSQEDLFDDEIGMN
ncbi:MAG: hypothetical protein PF486_14280 [Prolixibacteraceae bacterium]|jgi:hypothetical protein|nr:hypothetical protein [Prolixibacteraceae bacterium]